MNRRKGKYRFKTKGYKIGTVAIAALIPVISGFGVEGIFLPHLPFEIKVKPTVVILGSLITVINAWTGFNSYDSFWISNTEYMNKLETLLLNIDLEKAEKIDENTIYENAKLSFLNIMEEYNILWTNIRNNNVK